MGVISNIRDSADEKIDNVFALATAKAMENYYPRWRELSECEDDEGIKWDLPCIELESRLCNPKNLKMIRGGKHTPEFLELLSSD